MSQDRGRTHCQGLLDPSKRVPIFVGGTEANVKMVPICWAPISQSKHCERHGARHAKDDDDCDLLFFFRKQTELISYMVRGGEAFDL